MSIFTWPAKPRGIRCELRRPSRTKSGVASLSRTVGATGDGKVTAAEHRPIMQEAYRFNYRFAEADLEPVKPSRLDELRQLRSVSKHAADYELSGFINVSGLYKIQIC